MLLEPLLRDVTYAIRVLRRSPTYTLTALLTLALGLATTTAMFAVIDAALLRPLPFADPDRLVSLNSLQPGPNGEEIPYAVSGIEIVSWRDATRTLDGIEALQPRSMAMTGAGDPEVVRGAAVTSQLFATLGVTPARGRMFTADEEQRRIPVAVLSDRLWRRRFSSSATAIGQSIALDGRASEVIGVMPPGYRPLLDLSEVWVPLSPQLDPAQQNTRMTAGVARLRRGATMAQVGAELAPISARLAREFPASHGRARPHVVRLRESLLGQQRPALIALGAGVLLLLALACANVANLTLGHLAGRRAELTMRTLVGASRRRLIQQQVVQSLVLSAGGGALGLLVVASSLPALLALDAGDAITGAGVRIDWRVLAFAALSVAATGVLSGIVPALRSQRASEEGVAALAVTRIGPGRRERRIRGALVVLQVAMAVALLCASGTLLVSLGRLLAAPPGFNADGVLTMQLLLPPAKYGDVRSRADFVQKISACKSKRSGGICAERRTARLPPPLRGGG